MDAPLTRDQITALFSFHSSLRFVTLVTKGGMLVDSVKRAGLESLEPGEQTGRIIARWSLARGMTSASDEYFGEMKTIIIRRTKLVELLFPLSDYMVIISANPTFPLEKTAKLESLLLKLQSKGRA